jgi:Tfp pilus assembly protein PilE
VNGLTLLDLIITILVISILGFGILSFKACTDRISSNEYIEYCEKG